ncbi:MAG: hypothetical protein AAF716_14260, partial [Cyanobacteria bacterium P01_D01_bin.1]
MPCTRSRRSRVFPTESVSPAAQWRRTLSDKHSRSIWMASDISIDDQYLWVANRRLSMLVDFALEIADQLAKSDTELAY